MTFTSLISPPTVCRRVWSVYSGSVQLTGGLSITTELLHTAVQFNLSSQSYIDFTTDVDFYQELFMCLQMNRPNFHVRSACPTSFYLKVLVLCHFECYFFLNIQCMIMNIRNIGTARVSQHIAPGVVWLVRVSTASTVSRVSRVRVWSGGYS